MNASSMGRFLMHLAGVLAIHTSVFGQGVPGVTPREIVLGQSASFSGSFASQAASYRDGALAYFQAVNARGGVHGRKIRLLSLDDAYAAEQAQANTRRLIEEHKVFALFNYTWTNTVKASIPLAEQAGVPMIAPYTGYQELYTRPSAQVFTTRAGFSDELNQILLHLRTLGLSRIGLLHYDSPSGNELLAETRQRMESMQLKLQHVGVMKTNSKDPAAAVASLRDADLQALIIGASGSDAVAFFREFDKFRKGRASYYARSLIGIKQMVEELGPLSEGLSISQTAPNPFKDRAAVSVEYRKLLGQLDPRLKPDYIGLEGLIAAKVMVEALRRAGPQLTRAALVEAMQQLGHYDAGGYHLTFGPGKNHGSRYVTIVQLGRGGRIID